MTKIHLRTKPKPVRNRWFHWTAAQRTDFWALVAATSVAAAAVAAPLDDSGWEPLYPNQPRNPAVTSNTPIGGAVNPNPGASISRPSSPVPAAVGAGIASSPNAANVPPALPPGYPVGAPAYPPAAPASSIAYPSTPGAYPGSGGAPLGPPVVTGGPVAVGPPPGYPPLTLPPPAVAAAPRSHEIFSRQPTAGGPSMLKLSAPASAAASGAPAAPSAGMMSWFTTPAPATAPAGGNIVSPWNNRSTPSGASMASSGPVWGGTSPTPGAVPNSSFRVGSEPAGVPVSLVGSTALQSTTVQRPAGGLPPGKLVTLAQSPVYAPSSAYAPGSGYAPGPLASPTFVLPPPSGMPANALPPGGAPLNRPIPVGPPVVLSASPALAAGQYVGKGLFGQPKIFVQGQPVRNALRTITP